MTKADLLEGRKILIVDDEPDILETLDELLPMCELVKASTFEEAKKHLDREYFDLAVLDIMGVNGYVLLEKAKKKEVIAVMLTAHALSIDNTIRSYKEGAASYIPKDEMSNIVVYLTDILEAKERGEHFWWRWMERLGKYYEKKFGPNWKEKNKDFWNNFPSW